MPWKEPGDKAREPRNREPWGRGGDNGGGPDVDAWLGKLRRLLGPFGRGPLGALALLAVVVALWFLIGGWTSIGQQQVGVVLRLGRLEGVLQPGLHFGLPPPIERVQVVDKGEVRTLSDEVRLLTSDGQLALVDYRVQYKVIDARKFLFAARDAEESARNAATVAMRAVAGTHTLQQLLGFADGTLGDAMRARLIPALARAGIGIKVTSVGIQHIGVPSEVRQSFDGVGKAREEARTAQTAAAADVERGNADARVQAQSIAAEAESWRASQVADAHANAARFAQVLPQYQAAPQVTRHSLWLGAMRDVLSQNRVVVNTGSGNVIVQFPVVHPESVPAATPAPASAASVVKPAAAAGSVPAVTSGPALKGGET